MITQEISQKTRNQVHAIMLLSVSFCFALVLGRILYSGRITYAFLIWNLFLAWIPYGISALLSRKEHRINSKIIMVLIIGAWMLFFPNAPYIITDLFHLEPRSSVPLWYDLILILSFAWNGLIFGFLSLIRIQRVITRRSNEFYGWIFTICALFAGSFGIYLGRYERWNSWDIIANPFSLIENIASYFIHPFANKKAFVATIVFAIFLIICYVTIKILLSNTNVNKIKE